MHKIVDSIKTIQSQFNLALSSAKHQQDFEAIRITFLSRQGSLASLVKMLQECSPEEKREFGPLINECKKTITEQFEQALLTFEHNIRLAQIEKQKHFDITAYRKVSLKGSTHIYTQFVQELEDIFCSMGYEIADGPEVESDYYNFETLNIPSDHPARDMHDTFWISGVPHLLLRTHTSNMQARYLEKRELPLALFAPGRVYRNEATDASHDFMFMQGEVMLVDKNISMAHLLATARLFLSKIFGKKDVQIRVRPGYFPFVEPGVEIDAACPFCKEGCSICKKTGWIELLGAGLIHPNVFEATGIDTQVYSGFALGFGITRLAMIVYGITDIRLFHSSKISFLEQF